MKYLRFFIGAGLYLIVFFTSCKRNSPSNAVYLSQLKSYVNTVPESCKAPDLDFKTCAEPADTLQQNLPYSYPSAVEKIKEKLLQIDKDSASFGARQLDKALVCADFVYAAFSYRYLGDVTGINNDTVIYTPWDSLPLETCYLLGNQNLKAVYCNERSSFYLRLLKELTGINGKITSKDGTHTFPVITITDKMQTSQQYLVDPYDPFVCTRSGSDKILTYEEADTTLAEMEVHRTKRLFGKTRFLVSQPFMNEVKEHSGKRNYCSLLAFTQTLANSYIKAHGALDTAAINLPLFNSPHVLFNTARFEYAIDMNGRPDGQIFNHRTYAKYYTR